MYFQKEKNTVQKIVFNDVNIFQIFRIACKMSLNRICRLSHTIPLDQDRCAEGHPLAASLKCQNNNCNFATDPLIMSKIESALSLFKIHIKAVHAEKDKSDNEDKSGDKLVESDSDDEEKK